MNLIELIKNIISLITEYFKYKTISHKDITLENIIIDIENTKNEIVTELNKDNPNMHLINRLYTRLRNLSERKTRL